MRDHPRIHRFLVQHPQELAPLEPALPHFSWGNVYTLPPSSPGTEASEGSWWQRVRNRWRPPTIHKTDPHSMVLKWIGAACSRERDRLWVDLGTGDGVTLFRLASIFSGFHFIGVDLAGQTSWSVLEEFEQGFPHWSRRPPNVDYFLSILYPRWKMQPPDPAMTLLESGLDLLAPGGVGLLLTEHPMVLVGALDLLSGNRRVGRIHYSEAPMNTNDLELIGVEPYRPYSAEMGGYRGIRWKERYRRHGTFTWGYPIVFEMK